MAAVEQRASGGRVARERRNARSAAVVRRELERLRGLALLKGHEAARDIRRRRLRRDGRGDDAEVGRCVDARAAAGAAACTGAPAGRESAKNSSHDADTDAGSAR